MLGYLYITVGGEKEYRPEASTNIGAKQREKRIKMHHLGREDEKVEMCTPCHLGKELRGTSKDEGYWKILVHISIWDFVARLTYFKLGTNF